MDINAAHGVFMFILDASYFVVLLACLGIILSPVCENDSTALFVTQKPWEGSPDHVQFVSTRIMQCKYNDSVALTCIPWLFAVLGSITAMVFCETIHCMSFENHYSKSTLSISALLVVTVGCILLVRFDHVNLKGDYGKLTFAGFEGDPLTMHALGVAFLFIGILVLNITVLFTLTRLRQNYQPAHITLMKYIVIEFEFVEAIYVAAIAAFAGFFLVRQRVTAAALEYIIISLVVLLVVINRQLYYVCGSIVSNSSAQSAGYVPALQFKEGDLSI